MPKSVVVSDIQARVVPVTNLWAIAASLAQQFLEGDNVWGHMDFASHNVATLFFPPNNAPGQIASRPAISRVLAAVESITPNVIPLYPAVLDAANKFFTYSLNPTLPNLDAYLVSTGPASAAVSSVVNALPSLPGLILQTQIDYLHNILPLYWGFPINGVPSNRTLADYAIKLQDATFAAQNAGP